MICLLVTLAWYFSQCTSHILIRWSMNSGGGFNYALVLAEDSGTSREDAPLAFLSFFLSFFCWFCSLSCVAWVSPARSELNFSMFESYRAQGSSPAEECCYFPPFHFCIAVEEDERQGCCKKCVCSYLIDREILSDEHVSFNDV
jgi:hypothetical protein